MEHYEIFTADRLSTGRTRPRYEPLGAEEYCLGAEIWLFHTDGRIMVTQRHLQKREYPGKWECTGGSVCAGETTLQAILREVQEEIGLSFSSDNVKLVATECVNRQFMDLYAAVVQIDIGELTLQPEEVIDAKWVTMDELTAMRDHGEFIDFIYDRIMRNISKISF